VDDADDDRSSRAPEPDDVIRICRALNEAEARYLLIGGFAVIAHGAGRFTKDIDLLVDDAPENVARVRRALSVLPDNAAAEVADDDVRRYVTVCPWRPGYTCTAKRQALPPRRTDSSSSTRTGLPTFFSNRYAT